jgi:glycerophosphoryl diester phosphodiesterase
MATHQLRRVGHKGADLIAPGNTYASFDAALAHGVDMIEFDVLRERGGDRLLLAHDYEDAAGREPLTLEEGLAYLASDAFAGVELDVDLKLPGYEPAVVQALRDAGLIGRALVSTQFRETLTRIRALEPGLRLGWTVPKLRRDPFRRWYTIPPALVAVGYAHAVLPGRSSAAIRSGFCEAMMVHWRLVDSRLVRAVTGAGGELYVWTVDELPRLRALEQLGVTGVITNDPRLFAALA